MRTCYAVFHTNLAFSAVPEADRAQVIARCYTPLLDLVAEADVPVGIECSGRTLECIQALAPDWIARFKALLAAGRCSLVGSGYVQLIGPLTPWRVNRWNQERGLACYRELLDCRPTLALVNEMAYSASMPDLYADAGYTGLLLSRENAAAEPLPRTGPWWVAGPGGARLPVLWADALLFQKCQRLVHGDLDDAAYDAYLDAWDHLDQALPIYCSDVEIFGYRPKRYHYEQPVGDGEWARLTALFQRLKHRYRFVPPEQALQTAPHERTWTLTDCHAPITVKKQPKYNVARWAVSGKDDLYLNTRCRRLVAQLGETPSDADRARVCRLFSSDLRTHIHPPRLAAAHAELDALLGPEAEPSPASPASAEAPPAGAPTPLRLPRGTAADVSLSQEGPLLTLATPHLSVTLNTRRGLAVQRLAFNGLPLVGTLPHGYFHDISLGADFYTGGTVIELPGELLRLTDLEQVHPRLAADGPRLVLEAEVPTSRGPLLKRVVVHTDRPRMELHYAFPWTERPHGTVRVGHVTLLPEWRAPITLTCRNGGPADETLVLDREALHHRAVSSLISCTTGLGAVTGMIRLQDDRRRLTLRWDPAQCAAFPMLWHQPCAPGALTRILFSLAELDDTRGPGGRLLPFTLTLEP